MKIIKLKEVLFDLFKATAHAGLIWFLIYHVFIKGA